MEKYILDENGFPVPCDDLQKWSTWFETADRTLQRTTLPDCEISTVFLGINHDWHDGLLLYETLVFGGLHDGHMRRYTTRQQAQSGHNETVLWLMGHSKVRNRSYALFIVLGIIAAFIAA